MSRNVDIGLREIPPRMRRDHLIKDALRNRETVAMREARWSAPTGEQAILLSLGIVERDARTIGETVDARGITLYKDAARTVKPEEYRGSVERDTRDDTTMKRADARSVRQFGAYDRFTRRPIPGIYAPVEITCGKQSAHENYVRPWKPLR